MQGRNGPWWAQTYERWMEKEGIPVHQASAGIADIMELPRRPWARLGGYGTFVEMEGTKQAGKLLYVAEIPAGGSLEPEKHLYDEIIYVLRGRGLAEVWHHGQPRCSFEWGEGSLFAVPLNAWHRLTNASSSPVLFLAVTSAPVIMSALRNAEFIFNCDYSFTDRFTGKSSYFVPGEKRYKEGLRTIWETNFVPDVRKVFLDDMFQKVAGGQLTHFKLAAWTSAHLSEWPVGVYHKAHYHGPGAVLLGLRSVGYVLVWPREYGIHPFQDGYGDKVVRVDWKPGSIYSPCNQWFHQHFNTGREPARHLAITGGGSSFVAGRGDIDQTHFASVRDGGGLIEYEDEDPEIRRMFETALRQQGMECTMPPVTYRTDPFRFS